VMSKRCGKSPLEAFFWYNLAAKEGLKGESAPCQHLFNYTWRHPDGQTSMEPEAPLAGLEVGDTVLVKPPDGRFTSQWGTSRGTKVTSRNNVDVD